MAQTDHEPDTTPGEAPNKPARNWRRLLLGKKQIAVAVGVVLAVVAVAAIACSGVGESAPADSEITLGEFEFSAPDVPGIIVQKATFRLHVGLLRHSEQTGRKLLAARQFKVQQEIEQLLRRAASADFEDPLLADLKQQLQEIINETLGARVVEEIIITDLALTRTGSSPQGSFDAAAASTSTDTMPASPTDSDLIY